MKRIVFVLGAYYPDYSPNGICVKKVIDELKNEYEIHVVSERTSMECLDEERYDNVYIHRVATKEIQERCSIKSRRNVSNSTFNSLKLRFDTYKVKMMACLKLIFQKHTVKWPLVQAYYTKLEEIDCDILFGVCFPIEALLAVKKYKDMRRCFFGALLFDKFSTNISLHRSAAVMKAKFKYHLLLEREIFELCDLLLATHDWKSYIEKYHKAFWGKVKYIEIPALVKFDKMTSKNNEFVYSGMVYKKMRPVNKVFGVIKELKVDTSFAFCVKGNLSGEVEMFCSKDEKCNFYGEVPLERSYELIKNSRGLISIGNIDVTQTPSKIFEYVSTGKPIIHFYYDKEDRCIDILSKYQNAFCFNLVEYEKKDIEKLTEFIRKSGKNIYYDEVYQIFKDASPRSTAMIIESEIRRYILCE